MNLTLVLSELTVNEVEEQVGKQRFLEFFSDHWRGYNGLVDMGYKKHFRIHHGNDVFANGKNHINGIESFWPFAKDD